MIGRVHPGEPNGSLMMQEILKQLSTYDMTISNDEMQPNYLIVPMLNVDGVVNGNYRTSFSGKDLNRVYGRRDTLCPEV